MPGPIPIWPVLSPHWSLPWFYCSSHRCIVAVIGLVDLNAIRHLWRVKRDDLVLLLITFFATLIVGVMSGIFTGIAVSMVWFVVKTTRPHYAILGKLPESNDYRNVKHHQTESTAPILAIRFDAQFYYGNVSFFKEKLKQAERQFSGPLKGVVIDASSINQLDSYADSTLHELVKDHRRRGMLLYLANVKGPVMDVMKRSVTLITSMRQWWQHAPR